MGMEYVRQGCVDKVKDFEEMLAKTGVSETEVAFIGDDLTDVPLMQRSEFAVAVADAVEEVRNIAHYVTQLPGGHGAVREVVELILKAQGRWNELVRPHLRK